MSSLERAVELAARYHAGQLQRNGIPYLLHPLHVMEQVESIPAKIVAVLHDVVEDTPLTLEDLRAEGFNTEVVEAVRLVTKLEDVSYEDYIDALAHNSLARTVKLADLRHNIDLTRLDEVRDYDLERARRYHQAILKLEQAGK
ncbi:MAG: HD domain-containing protein [Deinococcota bacterium]